MTDYKVFEFKTKETLEFVDLTNRIKKFVESGKIRRGLVNLWCWHTSSAILVNENEPLLLEDIKNNLEKAASQKTVYNHDNFEKRTVNMCDGECVNGHSHCKAVYLPTSITLNLIDGKLQLGTWQSIFFVELDSARSRRVQVQILGD